MDKLLFFKCDVEQKTEAGRNRTKHKTIRIPRKKNKKCDRKNICRNNGLNFLQS